MSRIMFPTSRLLGEPGQRKALACRALGAWEVFALMPSHM